MTFNKCGPFADYETAFSAIDNIVLFDFGGRKTRFLAENEKYPNNEKLEYILEKVSSKIRIKPLRLSSRTKIPSFITKQSPSRDPSPIKLLRNQEHTIGSAHAFYGDINDRSRKRKK